jgi:hypothetical protein
LNITMEMSKAEREWKLDLYLEKNKNNQYIQKAKELYFHWR